MVQKRSNRTDQEWMELIKECRSSGLTDKDWCDRHGITRSNFYYHLRRLRKKSCDIPEATSSCKISLRQEVVPVEIRDSDVPLPAVTSEPIPHFPNPSIGTAICIRFRNVEIEIRNGADNDVIRNTLSAIGGLC